MGNGPAIGPLSFTVSPEVVRDYLAATGQEGRELRSVVPPTLASVFIYPVIAAMPVTEGVVLTRQRFEFRGEVRLNDQLRTWGWVVEQYERRGRHYMVVRTETRNQRGELVSIGHTTRMLPAAKGRDA